MKVSASLRMYDLPELAGANAAFLLALRNLLVKHGLETDDIAPTTASADPERIDPGTVFMQTCGYPLLKSYRDEAVLLATPCYAMEGCDGPDHRAFMIVRAEDGAATLGDLRGRVFGCNSLRSNTGMNLPRLSIAHVAGGERFFSQVVVTGGHVASCECLVSGSIDLCSIDCVTWGFLKRHRPGLVAKARILAATAPSPSLPFVTAASAKEPVRAALRRALAGLFEDRRYADIRTALALDRLSTLDVAAYETILDYERQAAALGYPELR